MFYVDCLKYINDIKVHAGKCIYVYKGETDYFDTENGADLVEAKDPDGTILGTFSGNGNSLAVGAKSTGQNILITFRTYNL